MAPLAPGTTLGDYEIVDLVGAGAMGVVYRARDNELHRTVALKVLADASARDHSRQQLISEARAASALNHPGICTIHHVDSAGGHDFIVMEFVDGRRLSEQIPSSGLALEGLLRYGMQIAEALTHAHEHGVVHRDLKSANVLVLRDGRVKIVDFGLAKQFIQASAETATELSDPVELGGTLAYMAPEVLHGDPSTAASDLWAFGVLLYEMSTGTLPFTGRTSFELTAQILRAPFAPLPAHVPVSVRTVITHCLAKEPSQRYRGAREIRAAIEAIQSDATIVPVPRPQPHDRHAWRWMAVAVVLVAAMALAWRFWASREARPTAGGQLVQLYASDRQALDPALAPDGSMVAFVAEDDRGGFDIFVSRVSGGGLVRVTHDEARESHPRFSPDGERLVFARRRPGLADPELCVVPAFGGQVSVIVPNAAQPVWSPDGQRVAFVRPAVAGSPLALATARVDGTDERVLVEGDGVYPGVRNPGWSPDGRSIVFVRGTDGVAGELWMVPVAGGAPRRVWNDPPAVFSDEPVFSTDGGAIIHASNRGGATNIWALPVDGGSPIRLTTGPGPDESPTVDQSGRLAFMNARWRNELFVRHLGSDRTRTLTRHSPFLWAPAFSPDGRDLAFSRSEVDGSWHIWTIPVDGTAVARQLTSGDRGEIYPRWTPDGRFVLYHSWAAPRRVWRVPRDGGPPVALSPADIDAAFADVSPDGRLLAYTTTEARNERVHVMSLSGEGGPRVLRSGPASLPRWSPDGEWIAFAPDRSYYGGVFIIRADGTGERRLSSVGGWPVWWPDGRSLSYLVIADDGTQRIDTVGIDGAPTESRAPLKFRGTNNPFDIARDATWIATSDSVHVSSEIWVMQPR